MASVHDVFSWTPFQAFLVAVFTIYIAQLTAAFVSALLKHGPKNLVILGAVRLAKKVPFGRKQISKELDKTKKKMQDKLLNEVPLGDRHFVLPAEPMEPTALLKLMEGWKAVEDTKWKNGKVSGAVYHGDEKLKETANKSYSLFSFANPLHPEIFPYVRKMEAEVVRMTLSLFHPPADACGTMTSGGTESILMAMKAYREQARERGITQPELVFAVSAHAAFLKACDYFCIKPVQVPVDPRTFRMDVRAARRVITSNTIALVGSSPGFPHGVIDPIEELSQLALKHKISLHVDCCLGSFLLPLCAELGYNIPPFDFAVPGVTSISCDPHKYGYTPKGTSVVMYRTPELRHHQYFVAPDWTGGIYASPSIAGSRSGGLIAGAWATMMLFGRPGYLQVAKDIMHARDEILKALREMPDLQICGEPDASVIAFKSADESALDIYKVQEAMGNRGWHLNALQYPRSMHICITKLHVPTWHQLVADLQESIEEVKANPKRFRDGAAAVYGLAESFPDRTLVTDVASTFLDTLFEV